MTKRRLLLVLFAISSASAHSADELDIARCALRDGLWEVARTHAEKAERDEASAVILESYAREGRWDDLVSAAEEYGDTSGTAGVLLKALALAKTGRGAEAEKLVGGNVFTNGAFAAAADAIRAEIALRDGDVKKAVSFVTDEDCAAGGAQVKAFAASLSSAAGDTARARRLWREVVADENASDAALASAAFGLGERPVLEKAYGRMKSADLRRRTGLRLGLAMLDDGTSFAEGERLVRTISKDAPDTPGAMDAAVVLADRLLSLGKMQEAADLFSEILSIWPDAASLHGVHEGRGWALRRLGRHKEAVEAFVRAGETADDDESKALSLLEQGDTLSDAGSGEEAMARYRELLARYPESGAAGRLKSLVELRELESKGRELYENYDFKQAMAVFAKLAEKSPRLGPRARFYRVLCLYGLRRDAEALEEARKLAASSDDPAVRSEAVLWLAKFSYNARKWKEAEELFSSFAEMSPKSAKAPAALLWAERAALAAGESELAVKTGAALVERYPEAPERAEAQIVQGEALMDLARFADAMLVFERASASETLAPSERLRAQMLKADALFAMGADNQARWRDALDMYQSAVTHAAADPGTRLVASYKAARTLEKLGRRDEAFDRFYADVVLAYRENAAKGVRYGDAARAAFVRAAFALADECESRGEDAQAVKILSLVSTSGVPAAVEADGRIKRINTKGKML